MSIRIPIFIFLFRQRQILKILVMP